MSIDKALQFVAFMNKFREVERRTFVHGTDRFENDVEHSYMLAMLAWYVNNTSKLNLNNEKILKYALAHDLVETYAGDTFFFERDKTVIDNKKERERVAALRIKETTQEFPELYEVIEMYEKREDEESKFVYALDKLEAPLKIYLDKGRSWQKNGATLQMLKEMKTPKIKVHPEIEKYFNELLVILEKGEKELFPPSH